MSSKNVVSKSSDVGASSSMSLETIELKTSDGVTFPIDGNVARLFTIAKMNGTIPLQNVTADILSIVIEHAEKHAEAVSIEDDEEVKQKLDAWDAEFMKNLDLATTFDIIHAATYLDYNGLLDLCFQTVADRVNKTKAEIRESFNMKKYTKLYY